MADGDDLLETHWPEMPQWRPIASAPKDGTVILLYDQREHVGIGIGQFLPETREVWERVDESTQKLVRTEPGGYWNANNGESIGLGQETITHWMPLPKRPLKERGDE
jgi:hypothetical protein